MALEYGNQEVVKFMYDVPARKVVLQVKQEILEDGVLKDHIFPHVVGREDDFDTIIERLLPSDTAKLKDADIKKHIQIEGKALVSETWAKEKENRKKQTEG